MTPSAAPMSTRGATIQSVRQVARGEADMGVMVRGQEPERERRRVEVIHSTSTEGVVTPLCIVWDDGRRFPVERVLERRPARSLKHGGQGVRFTVRVGQVVTHLWWDGTYWSVDARVRTSDGD